MLRPFRECVAEYVQSEGRYVLRISLLAFVVGINKYALRTAPTLCPLLEGAEFVCYLSFGGSTDFNPAAPFTPATLRLEVIPFGYHKA